MLPNVAIICANYNYGDYIIPAIESIVSQTYKGPLRLYVVDDGSSDDSWSKLSNWKTNVWPNTITNLQEVYIERISNSGASVARNVAINACLDWADIIGVLDADDAYYPEKVEKLVAKLVEHDEVGVVYADYENIFPEYSKREFKPSYSKIGLHQRCMVHSNALIKKKYLKMVQLQNGEFYDSKLHGPASECFIGCTEDYDLWLRLANVCVITHIPDCLAIANQHGNNQSMKMTKEIFDKNVKTMMER
jgi:glycosyltransferase involved in cell wall biosynthesis